jgi:hypothetical protein
MRGHLHHDGRPDCLESLENDEYDRTNRRQFVGFEDRFIIDLLFTHYCLENVEIMPERRDR